MEILHIFHEQHIATKELGLLHVVSEAPVSKKVVKEMVNAAAVLCHQYGAGRLGADGHQEGCSIYVQPLPKIDKKMRAKVSLWETDAGIYLANPTEISMFFNKNPDYCSQVYLMSGVVNARFHDSLRVEQNQSLDDVIQDVFNTLGLLYAVISEA